MDEGDEAHACKICDRTFRCGRALGGHMRSHMTTLKLPIDPKGQHQAQQKHRHQHHREEEEEEEEELYDEEEEEEEEVRGRRRKQKKEEEGNEVSGGRRKQKVVVVEDDDDDEELAEEEEDEIVREEIEENFVYSLRENPRRNFRFSDPQFSFTIDASSPGVPPPTDITMTSVHDSQSETEELSGPRRRPSRKKVARLRFPFFSGGEVSPEEPVSSISNTSPEEDVAISLMLLSRDVRALTDSSIAASSSPLGLRSKRRRKFQCGTCKKLFPSYQALGGHRAGHKKTKGGCAPSGLGLPELFGDRKIHECPFCFRVFGSGQALGGHKRTHFSGAGFGIPMPETDDSMLDLNLPATIDDSTSALSDAEFIDPDNPN
ncbi:Zinc finger protein [Nymphaea thermarum]|nr:Zinc finger protein [Nymphaea thermarum]